MKIFLVYLFLGIFQLNLFAQDPVIVSEKDVTINERGLTGLVKDWTFVKLDLTGVTPQGGILTSAKYVDGYVLLEGQGCEGKYFLLFNRRGKLLTRLDNRNMGVKSTDEFTRCSVDPFGKRIILVCGWKQIAYWYDFTGKLLGQQKFDADGVISELYYLDTKTVLCCNQIAGEHKTGYFIAKDDFKDCKLFEDYSVTFVAGAMPFANKAVSVNAGTATFMKPFCDTIFGYSDHEKAPRYILEAYKIVPDDFAFKAGSDYSKLFKQCRAMGMREREGIYETDRTFWIVYNSGVMCHDKISGKIVYANKGNKRYDEQMILPIELIGEAPDALVAAFTSDELKDMARQMMSEKIVCGKHLRELLQETTADNCVALIFYHLEKL